MTRITTTLAALALVVAAVSGAAGVGAAGATETDASGSADLDPGQQLAGVVDVQRAEVEGEIETRTLEVELSRAESNESKATVLARQLERLRDRLDALARRLERLERERQQGTISEQEYRRRLAEIAAELGTVKRLALRIENDSARLPLRLALARGVNLTAADSLRAGAENLSDPEVRRAARAIAGGNVSADVERGRTERRARAALERTRHMVRRTDHLIGYVDRNVTGEMPRAVAALERAKDRQRDAAAVLERMESAFEDGRYDEVVNRSHRGAEHVRAAAKSAHRARALVERRRHRLERARETIDRAERAVERAETAIAGAEERIGDDQDAALTALERARTSLRRSKALLGFYTTALDDGNATRAARDARRARGRAEMAAETARAAINASREEEGRREEQRRHAEAAIDEADGAVEAARAAVRRADARVGDGGSAAATLERAVERLRTAEERLAGARDALADDPSRAIRLAGEARTHARAAEHRAGAAIDLAETGDRQGNETTTLSGGG